LGILGVTTVDALSFQGRGGALFLDWLAATSPEHRERVLHHEAGHFLVAQLLNIPVADYSLSTWEAFRRGLPGQGGVIFDTQELEQEIEQGQLSAQLLNRYSMVWMAGIAAETLVYGKAQGGQDDRQNFRTVWMQLQRPIQECEARERWSVLQAQTLLERYPAAYEALVTAMQERASVADCQAAIAPHLAAASPADAA
jgi:hypothetical protein